MKLSLKPRKRSPKHVALPPAFSAQQAKAQFQGRRLSFRHYDRLVDQDELGSENGTFKYLFLRQTLPASLVENSWRNLRNLSFSESNHTRSSLGKNGNGGGTALGWLDKPTPRKLKPSVDYPFVDQYLLMPLLIAMSERMRRYLPEEWERQAALARGNGHRVLGSMLGNPDIPRLSVEDPIFSTLTVNRNVPFVSHVDGGNESLACLATFGEFSGSYLCLPRLRIAFDIQPGDLLIADTNHEQHGSISPRTGTRISVVAYLKDLKE
jgi:hypothetical protein